MDRRDSPYWGENGRLGWVAFTLLFCLQYLFGRDPGKL
jgi:hypothetical protein